MHATVQSWTNGSFVHELQQTNMVNHAINSASGTGGHYSNGGFFPKSVLLTFPIFLYKSYICIKPLCDEIFVRYSYSMYIYDRVV